MLRQIRSAASHKIPMLPGIAGRALELVQNPEVTVKDLESIIKPDPMVTARVLNIANSAIYTHGAPTTVLRVAIMRLGVVLMRDILAQTVAEAHIFRGAAESALRWHRLHAVSVAYLSRETSKALGQPADAAFLSGLFHDVGRTLLLQVFVDEPPEGIDPAEFSTIEEMIHAHVGKAVCERWGLPEMCRDAARYHHRYRGFGKKKDGYSQIAHLVAAAERLAQHVGLCSNGDFPAPIDLEREVMFSELGLDTEQTEKLIEVAVQLRQQALPSAKVA